MVFWLKTTRAAGFLAAAVTAALFWFGTGLDPWWPCLWLAPLPVLLYAVEARWALAALWAVAGWAAGGLNLESYYRETLQMPPLAVATAVVVPALAFASSVLLFRAFARRGWWNWAALSFPALLTALEIVFERHSPHGTGGSLAYSQLRCLPILQLAAVTGPAGITFLVLGFAAMAAVVLRVGCRALVSAGAAALVIIAVAGWGIWRLTQPLSGPSVQVGLVASDQRAYLRMAKPGAATQRQWEGYRPSVLALARQGAEVVVLPEKLGTVLEPDTAPTDRFWQGLADQAHIILVVGVDRTAAEHVAYNEARVYRPGKPVADYDKEHLLPPFEDRYTAGQSLLLLPEEGPALLGVAICKDLDFPAPANRYGGAGVGLVLAPAWDFGVDRIYHGHEAIMRGVESGYSIARAAKQGFLTISDCRGRVVAERASNDAPFATLMAAVPAGHVGTAYLKLGSAGGDVVLVLAMLCLFRFVWRGRAAIAAPA